MALDNKRQRSVERRPVQSAKPSLALEHTLLNVVGPALQPSSLAA